MDVQRFVGQVGTLAGVGLSLWGVSHAMRREVDPAVAAAGIEGDALVDALTQLRSDGCASDADLSDVRAVLDLSTGRDPRNQWRIARTSASILRRVRAACLATGDAYLMDDVLAQFEGALDDVLHNHLLDAS